MAVIRKDDCGLYAKSCGWIARPTGPSEFNKGDKVARKHFGGSSNVGIGKVPGSRKGDYIEYWQITGFYLS